MIRNFVGTAVLLSTLYLAGCSNEATEEAAAEKPVVAVSIVPEQTFVEAVCGDLVDIVTLVPAGSSPGWLESASAGVSPFAAAPAYGWSALLLS